MAEKRFIHIIKLSLLCVVAAGANYLFATLFMGHLSIPLFLDTVFTATVSFCVGLIPGLVTALLTHAALGIGNVGFNPFILCSIAEVLLICWLRPRSPEQRPGEKPLPRPETAITSFVSVLAKLMLLYIVCAITISVLGGLIDFIWHEILAVDKLYLSAEDTFKMGLIKNDMPLLATNILSRIPINVVDRFIVIFGGYFLSRAIRKII